MYTKTCEICGKVVQTKMPSKSKICRSCASKLNRQKAKIPDRQCRFCGKTFTPKSNNQFYCKGPHYRICPVCGKEYIEDNVENLKRPPVACSYECRVKKTQMTSMDRYGIATPGNTIESRNKAKQTMKERYGYEYTLQSPELREKVKATNLDRYGVENAGSAESVIKKRMQTNYDKYGKLPFNSEESYKKRKETVMRKYGREVLQLPEIQERIRQTMIDRYGVPYMMQVPEFRANQEQTMMSRYGVTSAFSSPEVRRKSEQTMIERYGVSNAAYSPELLEKAKKTYYERYHKHFRVSKINLEFSEHLNELGIKHELEHVVTNKFYDLYIPDQNTLIEIDPSYTHNVIGNHWGEGIDEGYHLLKTEIANDNGYRCIHVFDWDDFDKISEMLKPRKTIYARNCQIYYVKKAYGDEFLRKYHLQGTCRGQGIYAGLVYDGELIQLMTIGRPRYTKKYQAELLRLCTKPGYTVVGGASKLFKWIINTYEIESIISYCDRSKFKGDVYEKIGMKLDHITPPQEVWSYFDRKITANLLRQRGFDQLFGTDFGKGTSNEELMLLHGWVPVYDCGQMIYVYK